MRVVVLGSYTPSLLNFRGPLIGAMVAAGHEVTGCAPLEPGSDGRAVAEGLAALGARFQPVPLQRTGLNPLADAGSVLALARLFRRLRPDVLLAYTAKPVIYGAMAARLAGVPRVFAMIEGLGYAFTEGTELRRRLLRGVLGRLYRLALGLSDAVFFLNEDDRALFRERGILGPGTPSLRIDGTGIDLGHYAAAPPPAGPPSFLMIARLVRDKGVLEYVEAARLLRRRAPEARVRLLGPLDGNLSAIGPEAVARWQDEGAVDYLGETGDVRPYLRDCSVYVLPSYREGMPRTILEAMAVGRPVVTTTAAGCRDTVTEGGNGFLVPPRDAPALAEAMHRFVADPGLVPRLGAHSRALAERRFDVRRVNAAVLEAMGLA